ncbi:hypothetical protein JRQ81_015126 [Phrynocephalus forsythii]|uniref:Uncharacterized protein n=1 Tax=Phrynocephalus forsythii TaxID=171643 RepID=A0A9Q0XYN9_9SAUR|nr:hypothetical protein JRQ81_015126 [Phrynocephalus forsythii]
MDDLSASSVFPRPPVLQFFRNLFGGHRHVTQEGKTSKTKDPKGKDDIGGQLVEGSGQADSEAMLLGKNLSTTKFSPGGIHEGMMENYTKGTTLLKEMENTTPFYENKLSDLLNSTGMEMGDASGFAGCIICRPAPRPCEKFPVSGQENEDFGDNEALAEDGASQLPCADDGVSMATGTIGDVKYSGAEEEREHLLKEDAEPETTKTESHPWNRLINMYKQRRRLLASKGSHVKDVPSQPLIEEEAMLDLVVYGIAAPKAHVTLSNSAKSASACGLPEDEARYVADDDEIARRDFG